MENLRLMIPEVILSLFFAITFIQSGIDKVINKSGNLSWFQSVFENTIIKSIITPLFYWIALQELFAGIWMLCAAWAVVFCQSSNCFFMDWGYGICLIVLLQLFTGQRIAKDYVGASGIIPYIIAALLGAVVFQW